MPSLHEHLRRSKDRAFETIRQGHLASAVVGLGADLRKHPTTLHLAIDPAVMDAGYDAALSFDPEAVIRWIGSVGEAPPRPPGHVHHLVERDLGRRG